MTEQNLTFNSNIISKYLKKEPTDFTRQDIIDFIKAHQVQMIHLNHIAADGRLKTLSFTLRNDDHIEQILKWGERVDGSSLFPYIDPGHSDLNIRPRPQTAFLNPFTELTTLNMLCDHYDATNNPPDIAPEYIVRNATKQLTEKTGITLYALGELEYYVYYKPQDYMFPPKSQKNYHESKPFAKFDNMNDEILHHLTAMGVHVKYGHAEVGAIALSDGTRLEQFEVELDLEPIEVMADHLVIAKWIIRNVAAQYGVEVTFAPKISIGQAGSGLHIHIAAMKNGKNLLLQPDDSLSETALKIIGGLSKLASSLTAFGNTNPTSYLRLVPNQEAPTNICWGDRNRSVLIRVPLGWKNIMTSDSTPDQNLFKDDGFLFQQKQTIELRSPDGSSNVHLLIAGIAVAAKYGLTSDHSLQWARECYVDANIFAKENKHILEKLEKLPHSCAESADSLENQAEFYYQDNVFGKRLISGLLKELRLFHDRDINEQLKNDEQKAEAFIKSFLHCG
ncbi:MAG: glutamine synthetase [Planctomycetes bacterium]|nr:glutamine synthetase [Planctomycetota bacterium]